MTARRHPQPHARNRALRNIPERIPLGVVGLGLMGTSITTCLLAAGHPVSGVEPNRKRLRRVPQEVLNHLQAMRAEGLLRGSPREIVRRLRVGGDVSILEGSELIVEAITESVAAKKKVIRDLETRLSCTPIISTNTSAIPVSILQQGAKHPERILGIHWAEPAHITRFMEIVCGRHTDPKFAEQVRGLAQQWGKEPSILRRDIRGFITNRCFYALLREAFHLVESGYASIEDVDRSLRNDLGYWITFAGPFRFMDLTGIPAYEAVMLDLFPELNNRTTIPALMKKIVSSGAKGISNAKGFYKYSAQEAKRWEERFLKFTYDIRALALKYPDRSNNPKSDARRR
jgi:3-hydroxybutyryl-CoA dehydrogenase